MSRVCFGLLIFFSGEGGRSSSASRGRSQCLLLENFVFWQCSVLIGRAFSLKRNQSYCGVGHLGYARSIFVMTKSVRQHKITEGGKLQGSESSLICFVIVEGSTNALPVSTNIPAHFCIPVSLYQYYVSKTYKSSRENPVPPIEPACT